MKGLGFTVLGLMSSFTCFDLGFSALLYVPVYMDIHIYIYIYVCVFVHLRPFLSLQCLGS